jgi:heme A synthase
VNPDILLNLKRLALLVLAQVVVGVFVVVSKLAFSMTAVHLLIALLIVGVILNLLFINKEANS